MERRGRGGESGGGGGGATGHGSLGFGLPGFSAGPCTGLTACGHTCLVLVVNVSERVHSRWSLLSQGHAARAAGGHAWSRPQQAVGGCPCPQLSDKEAEPG